MNLKFNYKRFSIVLERYFNVYWNTLSYDSKTTSGYIFSIARRIVSWKSKKLTILTQSTMVSEIIALATASEEVSWVRFLYGITYAKCVDPLQ
jgi:hypothetical protein